MKPERKPQTDLNLDFSSSDLRENPERNSQKATKTSKNRKLSWQILFFIVSLILLILAIIFFFVRKSESENLSSADFLVENSPWVLTGGSENCETGDSEENSSNSATNLEADSANSENSTDPEALSCESPASVIWDFTELGEGTLTTNSHKNDYDFTWSLDGDTLSLETAWLYDLDNSYAYSLNQPQKTIVLTDESGQEFVFASEKAE